MRTQPAAAGIGRRVGWVTTRATELLLAVGGLTYAIFGTDSPQWVALFLFLWATVAVFYLVIGGIVTRRARFRSGRVALPSAGRRFSFFITVAASITGLTAALDVLSSKDETEYAPLINGLGVVVTICAWLLLHIGYARFYATWRDDLHFPRTDDPGIVDFLYFAVTLGVSFAASDVEVRSRPLRWHVMVHSVVSFFYNAIVLAVAVGVITGK